MYKFCFCISFFILLFTGITGEKTIHSFKATDIAGKEFSFANTKGKVVLMVNVASKCGLTPQYKQLQALHDKFASKGLLIVAFPANNFRRQEPGSNFEIKQFCESNYGVKFQLMSKISVAGSDQHSLYKYLTSHKKFGGKISWNFEKFLINKSGEVVNRFKPQMKPNNKKMVSAIESLLK